MITIQSVTSIIDVCIREANAATIVFFKNKVERTYSDNFMKEHLYNVDVDAEDLEGQPPIVLQEMEEITKAAREHNAGYVRFIY